MKTAILFIFTTITIHCLLGQSSELNDGPYIFIAENELIAKEIKNGEVITTALAFSELDTSYAPQKSTFQGVPKIVALSDIHGQYDLAVAILKNNQIIDDELNWSFGNGHMVVVGDIFDRGPKVTEVLWLIYKLEKQAKEAGGFVHFLLGNHEYMVLHKDLRYLHEKYEAVSGLLKKDYDELFGKTSILGRWLRSKPTVVKINEWIFVHGGVSNDFLNKVEFNIGSINDTMRKSIDRTKEEMKSSDFYNTYYGRSGPIWYRGYFYDDLPVQAIDSVLDRTKSSIIIVGHCSNDEVVSLYDNKIFGVDSSIKKGEYGEVLFLTGDSYYRGTKDGNRVDFK